VDPHQKLTISMRTPMLHELRQRARAQGMTVTALIRRAVSLERMLDEEPAHEVVLRHRETGEETVLKVF
jgi:hypothetical protein